MRKLFSTLLLHSFFLFESFSQNSVNSLFLKDSAKIVPPNIILIMADDLGYGDIGCYGNTRIKTPNLDRMANEGILFLDFHSNGTVSSPTRASLMTGKYQQRTGIVDVITAKNHRDVGLSLSEITIAEVFKENGYKTGVFGKWHLGYSPEFNPVRQGFDEFIGYVSGNVDYHSKVDQEGYYDWWDGDQLTNQRGYTTDLITSNSIDFIKRNKESPFFLFIAHEAPHYPYQNRESKAYRTSGGRLGIDYIEPGADDKTSSIYKDMIEILDGAIGEVFKALKALDLDSNTIVFFCSDNGANQNGDNGPLKGYKGAVWEGGHRVPAIIRWAGHFSQATTSSETMLTMDIFPTLLELTGIDNSYDLDGKSVAKHLLHKKQLPPRTLFWQHKNQYAVRKKNWKLVVFDKKNPELYDLKNDLNEALDLSGRYPDKLAELLKELDVWDENILKKLK